jgi:hypothetical protein
MPRLWSRTWSGVPPWWKTTLRPVSADVATTAAEISRPLSTWRSISWKGISFSSVCLSGVASSSAGTSSDSRPVKVSAARAIRSRSRIEGVASTSPHLMFSQIARPVVRSADSWVAAR